MYAIVELSGRQCKVQPGSRVDVNRLSADVGQPVMVERVLLAHDGTAAQIGRPYVPGAAVLCEVVEHRLGPKVMTFKFRRRENWRKLRGHRQPLTRLLVKEIRCGDGGEGAGSGAVAAAEPAAKAGRPRAARPSRAARAPRSRAAKPKESAHGA
jgi:large subunit ribosomal protein L21